MINYFEYTIDKNDRFHTIDSFLREKGYSRQLLTDLKKIDNGITINGEWARVKHRLSPGEKLGIKLVETVNSVNIVPKRIPFAIIYEDDHLLVVDKPADMPIHPSQGNYENTLANAVAYYYKEQGKSFIYRCINRLDRDTTGLLIIAKHKLSSCILQQMSKDRAIKRTYLAIAEGIPDDEGTIDAPIGRKADSTIERCVDFDKGESAVTHYKRKKINKGLSLIQLNLETGRTHQIRVHMKYIGHPLIGDFLYNPNYSYIKRQALHSYQLDFQHPITQESLHFTAPLPHDMAIIMEYL